MNSYIKEHLIRLENENLSSEAKRSLNFIEAELGMLYADLSAAQEKLMKNRYVTIPEAAKLMNINRKRLDLIIRNSEIPVIKYTARTIFIDLADLRNYINSKKLFYTNNKEETKKRS